MRKLPPTSDKPTDFPPLPPSDHKLEIKDIDPGKFHKVDEVRKGPCDICGKRWVKYIERWYPGKRPDSYTHKVCEHCMSKAVTKEIMSVRTLPGMIDIIGMNKIHKSIGKCDVCKVAPASWLGGGVKLCETCYKRESRQVTGRRAITNMR